MCRNVSYDNENEILLRVMQKHNIRIIILFSARPEQSPIHVIIPNFWPVSDMYDICIRPHLVSRNTVLHHVRGLMYLLFSK